MKNWKTTAAGIAAAICEGLAHGLPEYAAIFRGVATLALAIMGVFAKDSNVTGGTTQQ